MSKNSFQKGSVQISTFARMAIIAAVVVVASTIAVIKYREATNVVAPVAVTTPKLSPSATPMPIVDETADWKTYKNEKYGFEIKYPVEIPIEVTKGSVFIDNAPDEGYGSLGIDELRFNVPNENIFNISIYSSELWKKNKEEGNDNIIFLGRATSGIYQGLEYIVDLRDSKNKLIANQILSTFKFTK